MSDFITIDKTGDKPIRIGVQRTDGLPGLDRDAKSKIGLTVTIQTIPKVEEFMASLGGDTVAVGSIGRYWSARNGGQLMAYTIGGSKLDLSSLEDGSTFTLDKLGQPILEYPDRDNMISKMVVNLSPLRLVGTSEGAGVSFGVKGVYSTAQVAKIRDMLGLAARRFYWDYMKPVDFSVTLNLQELKL